MTQSPLGRPLELIGDSRFVRIPSRGLFGSCSASPNGEFKLVMSDPGPSGRQGKEGYERLGHVFLLHNANLALECRLERPHYGKVSDTGVFVVADLGFDLRGWAELYAFDVNGTMIFQCKFGVSVLRLELDREGKAAICFTAGGVGPDANKMTLIDLQYRERSWTVPVVSGIPNTVEFEHHEALLWFQYEGKGRYRYSMTNGDFVDFRNWSIDRIEWASASELYSIAVERVKSLNNVLHIEDTLEVIWVLTKAIRTGIDQWPYMHASALRLLGEAWESLGNNREALDCYIKADFVYGKAGVKRRIVDLKRKLGI